MNIRNFFFYFLIIAVLISGLPALFAKATNETLPTSSTPPLDLELVLVDHPNNAADVNGLGRVADNFLIAKYDTTAEEYCAFLNAVETTGSHGFYHPEMGSDPSVKCISQSLAEDGVHFIYSIIDHCGKLPITYVSWIDAVCFCNWLHHGCPTGEDVTEEVLYTGAYLFSKEGDEEMIVLQPNARYFLPDSNQYHKATFYRPQIDTYWNYPTRALSPFGPGNTISSSPNQANYHYTSYFWGESYSTHEPPYVTSVGAFSGSPGPFGTYDMGSNVKNWSNDFNQDGEALAEGGSWKTGCDMLLNTAPATPLNPTIGYDDVSFRIAAPAETPINAPSQTTVKAQQLEKDIQVTERFVEDTVTFIAFNVFPEIVEVIAYSKLKLFFLVPYVLVIGSEIAYELAKGNNNLAAAIAVHMLFDIAVVLADQCFTFDLASALGDVLDYCRLSFVKNAFVAFHENIDYLIHLLGISHTHAPTDLSEEESLTEMLEENFEHGTSTSPSTVVQREIQESSTHPCYLPCAHVHIPNFSNLYAVPCTTK